MSEWRLELADVNTVTTYVKDLHNLLSISSLIEEEVLIWSYVKEITITGKKVLLTYMIPVLPDGTSEESQEVLSIIQYGGR